MPLPEFLIAIWLRPHKGQGYFAEIDAALVDDGLPGGIFQSAADLKPGETLQVDTGCIVAFDEPVGYDIQFVGGIKTALFGGEGLFFATLRGPGRVWLQSLPLSRMADRIVQASRITGKGGRGEGSLLGGIGSLLDGDNS